jgi:hypothetical protein
MARPLLSRTTRKMWLFVPLPQTLSMVQL